MSSSETRARPGAYLPAALSELLAPRSKFNSFAVVQTCVGHTFVDHAAARELGYAPTVPREEAFARSLAWLRESGLAGGA